MAKKRKNDRWSLPPEGLWISPAGVQMPINEHLMALAEAPEQFGLSQQEVAGADEMVLRKIAERLISQGWMRFRYLDGVYNFEVDDARKRVATIEEVLAAANAIPEEAIFVVQFVPPKEYQGTVADLYERSLFRLANKKRACKWAFSYSWGKNADRTKGAKP
jgi:hypothetical protein